MSSLSADQKGVIRYGLIGLAFAVGAGLPAYLWAPRDWLPGMTDVADRFTFALKWDIPVLIWLAGCVRQVSSGRFRSPADIAGSAFSTPSHAIAVKRAVPSHAPRSSSRPTRTRPAGNRTDRACRHRRRLWHRRDSSMA